MIKRFFPRLIEQLKKYRDEPAQLTEKELQEFVTEEIISVSVNQISTAQQILEAEDTGGAAPYLLKCARTGEAPKP